MTWHWFGLVVFSVTLLPAGLSLVSGRVPHPRVQGEESTDDGCGGSPWSV
ncbi:hypothetical protein [Streptomyces sp. NPDC048825]